MKLIVTLLLVIVFSHLSIGQDSTIALSKFELFTSQPNKLLKKEMRTIGNFGRKHANTFKTTDLITGNTMMAVRIGNFNTGDMPDFIHPLNTYIDFSELDPVISALNAFLLEAEKARPQTDIAFSYITSNDICFSAYYDQSNGTWEYRMGKLYKHRRTYVIGTITRFNSRRFAEFVTLLKEAKAVTW